MHCLMLQTALLALAISPVLTAPIPDPQPCAREAISFLGPRTRSILSIRESCDDIHKRREALAKRGSVPVSSRLIRIPALPLNTRLNDADDDESADAFSHFELVQAGDGRHSYDSSSFVIATDRDGKTRLLEADFELPFADSLSSDTANDDSWREWQSTHKTHHGLFALVGHRENLVVLASVAVLLIVAVLLVVEMVLSARRNGWTMLKRRRQRARLETTVSFGSPSNEKSTSENRRAVPTSRMTDRR